MQARAPYYPRFAIGNILGLAILALLAGCGGRTAVPHGTVEGRVTVNGVPVTTGSIIFSNAELGVMIMGELDAAGYYEARSHELPGLPVGKYTVAIYPLGISKGDFVPIERGKAGKSSAAVPERYRDGKTSPLKVDVKEGKNPPFNFDLPTK